MRVKSITLNRRFGMPKALVSQYLRLVSVLEPVIALLQDDERH
ncbi:hypothetical protein ACQKDS_19665 [Serratia sp. NPDC078593]